jgi:hypothetical protein
VDEPRPRLRLVRDHDTQAVICWVAHNSRVIVLVRAYAWAILDDRLNNGLM